MSESHEKEEVIREADELSVIDGELVADEANQPAMPSGPSEPPALPPAGAVAAQGNQRAWLTYIVLPAVFLTSALFGGLRIAADTSELVFIGPPLICLVFATAMVVLFFRTGLIDAAGWFSESIPTLQNAANAAVLIALFAATVQIYNSLIPEQGIAFWVVSFCFIWTIGVSYFTLANAHQLVRTSVAMFAIAFLTKYFLLLNLTSSSSGNWLQRLWDDPTREAFTYLLDLPRFAPSTGYIQFFAVGLYILGLFLLPRETSANKGS